MMHKCQRLASGKASLTWYNSRRIGWLNENELQ